MTTTELIEVITEALHKNKSWKKVTIEGTMTDIIIEKDEPQDSV